MHQDKGEEKSNKAKIHQLSLAFISSSSNCDGKVLLSEVKFISNDVLQQKKKHCLKLELAHILARGSHKLVLGVK
jgi:hypothetical protein